MIIASLVAFAGIAVLAALVFRVAVHALPVLAALGAAQVLLHLGASTPIAAIAAIVVAFVLIAASRMIVLIAHRAPRIAAASLFVLPAIHAGHAITSSVLASLGIAGIDLTVLASLGGLVIGAAALGGLASDAQSRTRPSSLA